MAKKKPSKKTPKKPAKKAPKKPAKKAPKPAKKALKKPTKKAPKKPAKKAPKPAKKAPKKAPKKPTKKATKKPVKKAPKAKRYRVKAANAAPELAYIHRKLREGVRAWQDRLNVEGWDSQSRTYVNSDNTIDSQIDFHFDKKPTSDKIAMLAYDCQRASKIPIMNKTLDANLFMSTGFFGFHKASGQALYGKGANEPDVFETYPMNYGLGNTTFLTLRDKFLQLVDNMKITRFFVRLSWSSEDNPRRRYKHKRAQRKKRASRNRKPKSKTVKK